MILEELNNLLSADRETEHLEFKEQKNQMSILGNDGKQKKSLYGYCVALGNEGGGYLLLGVKNNLNPLTGKRDIVGTNALSNFGNDKQGWIRQDF
jgi:ATP-dependent DNA helicase RecG